VSFSTGPHKTGPDRPFECSYWVVRGRLIAGCYPGSPDRIETRDRLSRMLDLGITQFVSPMEAEERDHSGNAGAAVGGPAARSAAGSPTMVWPAVTRLWSGSPS